MSGIVGIVKPQKTTTVKEMLDTIAYRGSTTEIMETPLATLGITVSDGKASNIKGSPQSETNPIKKIAGRFVIEQDNQVIIKRDPLGVAPLYYGWTDDGLLCFASEVKGLLAVTMDVHELPPGHTFDGQRLRAYYQLHKLPEINQKPERIAKELHRVLEGVVKKHASMGVVGSWLSGGLDSSVMATLGSQHTQSFHTFAAGMPGSPDLKYARMLADHIKAEHHEVVVNIDDLLKVLPDVIYHLESFDAWLVRSSIMNFLVSQLAAEYVTSVFSGEGGDELFGGYRYLKSVNPANLADELIDITSRLHNTALQRVDRCASAHGTDAYVDFLEPDVVDFALRIPTRYKLHNGVEKWILRQAMAGDLPEAILNRPKAKFWQGAGVQDLLARHAKEQISDGDFSRERRLPNGWRLNSKEELLYYKIFCERLGQLGDLSWMGRTKGMPVN
jgi:asparagine synthase (glutamine-hydrolysing)